MTLIYPQVVTGADLLRGINKLTDIAPLLQRRGATAAAIVNSKMYGVHSFYQALKRRGIQPVIGLSVMVELQEGEAVLVYVYARNEEGYRNLLKMSSAVSVRETDTLPLQWFGAYSMDCVIVCPLTDSSWDGSRDEQTLALLIEKIGRAVLAIGIARPGGERHTEETLIENIALAFEFPVAAVYESRFTHPDDAFSYEVATAIREGHEINDGKSRGHLHKYAYLPEEAELTRWFSDKPEWLEEMVSILQRCTVNLSEGDLQMPVFPVPNSENAQSYLRSRCIAGLKERVGDIAPVYDERLQYELSVIAEMGYTDYFLIVEDFMRFAADHHILTGPGRGSSAGSLVAFALHITDVDPIRYGLIFERFLNPERLTMPDIDIDFADNRRMEVIQYVAKKYGKAHVAQIITFGTLSARSVARNVARVFQFPAEELAFLSNAIPNRHSITLKEARQESKRLRDWIEMDPIREKWFKAALALEGLPRNASTHAAGVVLSPAPLVNTVPLQDGGEGIYLTQWPMKVVEDQGLLKMDFLGLRNLTLLDRIRTMIAYDKKVTINFEQIPLQDEKTFELFKAGDTTGVFQFESDGMRETLKLIQPNTFEDLFAINALYRPGPMENIPVYGRRKHRQENITYMHPLLEPILGETYGIIVYQEQIMQIAVHFANYSMGEADLLRRAISKKNRDVLIKEKARFTERAVANGVEEKTAATIYNLIVKFADYGFPKSHAVAYSLISYRLAFLKAHEPAYFYAALLSSTAGNADKAMSLMREAEARGIRFLPPSVNDSKYTYTVENGAIRIGLGSIKGIPANFYAVLREVRKSGTRWRTLFDFAASIGAHLLSEKVLGALIKAGALDEFGETRAVLLASIDAAMSHASFIEPGEDGDLLASYVQSLASPKYSPAGVMPRMTMLAYEKEVLGFYLSAHPATEMKKSLDEQFATVASIDKMRERSYVKILGLLTDIKRIRTKKGEAMAFVTVQDESGSISCTFFPQQFSASNAQLQEMEMIRIEGTIERRRGRLQIIVQHASGLS